MFSPCLFGFHVDSVVSSWLPKNVKLSLDVNENENVYVPCSVIDWQPMFPGEALDPP